jgi:carbonic anhydrase/acetyltransferase-like protein (isoleucine patch superfamily)
MTLRSYKGIHPSVGERVYIDPQALVAGDIVIGDDSSIWPMCSLRGDVNIIRIGARTNIQDGSVVHVTHPYKEVPEGHATIIGDDVTIGHKVIAHGCTIESRVLIGMGSIILDGAFIHSHVFLGAGSLVAEGKELEGGYLWLGTPAKKIRPLNEKEIKWFDYSAMHYVKLKDDYLNSQS